MTYKTQNKVTHSNTETGRELTVTQEFEDKFPGVAEHWVKGGEVEFQYAGCAWVDIREKQLKRLVLDTDKGNNFRIKKRKPQPGEVWINGNTPALITSKGFVWLTNNNHMECDFLTHVPCAEYAATSVLAYYARELLSETAELTLDNVLLSCEEYNN